MIGVGLSYNLYSFMKLLNPNILPVHLPPYAEDRKSSHLTPLYKELEDGYREVARLVGKKRRLLEISWRLDYSLVDADQGHGCFGAIPDLRDFIAARSGDGVLKKLLYYWPRDVKGRLMSYLGSVNAGSWVALMHRLLAVTVGEYRGEWSPYGVGEAVRGIGDRTGETWFHFWVEDQPRIGGDPLPDCFIHVEHKDWSSPEDQEFLRAETERQNLAIPLSLYESIFRRIAETTAATTICAPRGFLSEPRLAFGVEADAIDWKLHEKLCGHPLTGHDGDMTLFGTWRSQQVPHKWLSPNPLPTGVRYLVPLLNFNDTDADMTYQFSSDLPAYDRFAVQSFSKIEASCT